MAVDFEAVLEACLRTGTILELDAQPARLDLPDTLVRAALAAGLSIAIDSDAHTVDELRFIETFGIGAARRAWTQAAQVINTRPLDAMLAALKGGQVAQRGRSRAPAHPR